MQPFTLFICHRRADTAPIALLLKHEIEKRLQFVRVVVDVHDVHPGERLPDRIRTLLDASDAVLALVGPQWMPAVGTEVGATTFDWVAHELGHVAPGGTWQGKGIIPIFVNCERSWARYAIPAQAAYICDLRAEHIDHGSWPTAIGPLLDNIADTLGLAARPIVESYPLPDPAKARTQSIGDDELRAILGYNDYDGWYVDNLGQAEARYLAKTFRFGTFEQASAFMARVSEHCAVLNHHPDWRNVYNHISVQLTTWDARRRVTIYDLNLALFMNKVAQQLGA